MIRIAIVDDEREACERLAPDRRYIQVRTAQTDGFAVLSFHNSCDGQTVGSDTPLATRKRDNENHGFGLPNIRRVAEKYAGEVTWRAQDGEFTLTLLFAK